MLTKKLTKPTKEIFAVPKAPKHHFSTIPWDVKAYEEN